MMKIIMLVLMIPLMTGCASGYKSNGFTGGFSETQLSKNTWQVSFEGNGYTKHDRANDLALLRAADLTLQNNFYFFQILNSDKSTSTNAFTTPATAYTHFSGSHARTNVYGGDTIISQKPLVTHTISMFKDKPESEYMTYDAEFICKSIGSKYDAKCGIKP